MFEAVQLGRKISKSQFNDKVPELRTELLQAQLDLETHQIPVLVIVAGVHGAGKGDVVNRLNQWLDTRGLRTHAYWDETDEELERPQFWRFWRSLPPRGKIAIHFGSWYTQPLVDRVRGRSDDATLDAHLKRVSELERMLSADGTLVVKFWFHISGNTQVKRIKQATKSGKRVEQETRSFAKKREGFLAVAERVIRITDTGECPWYLIEAEDKYYRDLTVGQTLLNAIRHRVQSHVPASSMEPDVHEPAPPATSSARITILDHVDLTPTLTRSEYTEQLGLYKGRLEELAWKAYKKKRSSVILFEGWDAAGKGGTIRRITAATDARLYSAISISAPTDEEKAHHYLWRFWRHIPRAGYMTIYDRSWYGRVLVERVEGFAKQPEWMRAYREINDFEEQLYEHGIIVSKFWVHISAEEQLTRFRERERVPWKQHKITEDDWRNREKWDAYKAAVNDMVSHTSTAHAPWFIIPGNDKKFARIEVLRTVCERLETELS